MNMNKNNDNEKKIRNNVFYLAPRRMKINKKVILTGILTFLVLYIIYSQMGGLLTQYIYLEVIFVALITFMLSYFVEYVDYRISTQYLTLSNRQMMIGYSNLVTIYDDDYTISRMYHTDEIHFKKVSDMTLNNFYPLKTTVVECYKNGELKTCIGIKRCKELEGTVLYPNKEKEHKDVFTLRKCDENCDKCPDRVYCETCSGNCEICSMKVYCDGCSAECESCSYKELCNFCDGVCMKCEHNLECPSCMNCCERCEHFDKCNHKNYGLDEEEYDDYKKYSEEDTKKESEIISGDTDLSGSDSMDSDVDDIDDIDDVDDIDDIDKKD